MSESTMVFLLGAGVVLWMIGGGIEGVQVPTRWVRIVVWPILAVSSLWQDGLSYQRAVILLPILMAVTSLPYGKDTKWPVKIAVFASYGLPAMVIEPWIGGFSVILCAAMLSVWRWTSNRWNALSHKTWEGLAGFCQATTLIVASLR